MIGRREPTESPKNEFSLSESIKENDKMQSIEIKETQEIYRLLRGYLTEPSRKLSIENLDIISVCDGKQTTDPIEALCKDNSLKCIIVKIVLTYRLYF